MDGEDRPPGLSLPLSASVPASFLTRSLAVVPERRCLLGTAGDRARLVNPSAGVFHLEDDSVMVMLQLPLFRVSHVLNHLEGDTGLRKGPPCLLWNSIC